MPPAKSSVWKYFKRSGDDKTVKCSLCSTELTWTGETSNMHNHLRGRHPSELSKSESGQNKQISMSAFVNSPRKMTESQTERVTQAIADMVVLDYVPLSIVDGEGFRKLMEIVAPEYKVPARNTIRSRIVKRYDDEKDSLVTGLQNIQCASLTTDTWTSSATESYITVTEHHIDDEWELHSNVLMTRAMPERHTGQNIANKLKCCASEFGLESKVETVVHDNARNMDSACEQCPEWNDLGCFGHTLQLCIKPAYELGSVSKILAKCRKLVGHFKHSTTLTAEMRTRQKTLQVPEHELIQDVPTRWNSTQMMIERLCEQRRVVTDIMLDTAFTKKIDVGLLLSNCEWDIISELSVVLKDLTKVSEYMCTENNVSCSVVYPIVCGLLKTSLCVKDSDSSLVRKVKDCISGELIRRYQPSSSESAQSTLMIASLLDPRYKRLNFLGREQRQATEEALESQLDAIPLKLPVREKDCDSEPVAKRAKCDNTLDFLVFTSPDKSSDNDELKAYLCEKSCADNPLRWWKKNESKFPRIAHVAKKLLSIPATSVPSERIFSSAGLLVNKLRNRLSSDLVDSILFLNKNKFRLQNDDDE